MDRLLCVHEGWDCVTAEGGEVMDGIFLLGMDWSHPPSQEPKALLPPGLLGSISSHETQDTSLLVIGEEIPYPFPSLTRS